MKRILVAVDGSAPSIRAAQRAAAMASPLGLSVTLMHVMLDHSYFGEWKIGGDETELHRAREEEAQALLAKVAAESLPGAEVDKRVVIGTPAEAIAKAARAPDVELIVVGSRGRTLIGGVLIGSVAHRLVHICDKPILIVH